MTRNDKVCFGCITRIGVAEHIVVTVRCGVTVCIGVAERIGVTVRCVITL